MTDRFTADKMAWLERVQDDPAVSAAAFGVAFAIARHLNRKTGEAWPGQATLGAMAGVGERQVRNLLKQLTDAGHIEVTAGGFQRPDRYRLAAPDRQPVAAIIPEKDCRSGDAPDRKSSDRHTGNGLPPNPLKEPSEDLNPERPVCVSVTHRPSAVERFKGLEANLLVARMASEAGVKLNPADVISRCQSFHGEDWQAKLERWTAGAIARVPATERSHPRIYDGPAELRHDILGRGGEKLAAYLDHYCRWREEDRTILCRSDAVARRIADEMGKDWFGRREVSVGVMAANDVPITQPKGRQSWV